MLVSFDTKFIRQDQKQSRNGEACGANPTCFWSSLINVMPKDTYVVFYLSSIISSFYSVKTAKQMKKTDTVLLELTDIGNVLRGKSVTSFNQSKRSYHSQH